MKVYDLSYKIYGGKIVHEEVFCSTYLAIQYNCFAG